MSGYISKDREINILFSETSGMYRNLVESVHNGIYMADINDTLFFVNQSFVEMMGYKTREDLLGRNIAKDLFYHPEMREEILREMELTGFVKDCEIDMLSQDGSVVTISVTSNFIRNAQGIVIGVEGFCSDITEKKLLQMKLEREKEKLEEILTFDERVSSIHHLDRLTDFIVEKATAILQVEKCSLMLLDDENSELCIKSAKGLNEEITVKTRIRLGEGIAGSVARTGKGILVHNIESDQRYERKNRPGYRGVSFMSMPIKIHSQVIGVVNVSDKICREETFSDMDVKVLGAIVRQAAVAIENAKLYRELEYLAVTDPLTNLCNYRCLIKDLDIEINRVNRSQSTFSLLMIDVDQFKSYNDQFGHLQGDLFLKTLGKILTGNLRVIDKVCRYGGDEFVILLPMTILTQAKIVAEKLRLAVAHHPFERPMTISIGIAEFNKPLTRFELIMRVDRALYQSKRMGRNQVYP